MPKLRQLKSIVELDSVTKRGKRPHLKGDPLRNNARGFRIDGTANMEATSPVAGDEAATGRDSPPTVIATDEICGASDKLRLQPPPSGSGPWTLKWFMTVGRGQAYLDRAAARDVDVSDRLRDLKDIEAKFSGTTFPRARPLLMHFVALLVICGIPLATIAVPDLNLLDPNIRAVLFMHYCPLLGVGPFIPEDHECIEFFAGLCMKHAGLKTKDFRRFLLIIDCLYLECETTGGDGVQLGAAKVARSQDERLVAAGLDPTVMNGLFHEFVEVAIEESGAPKKVFAGGDAARAHVKKNLRKLTLAPRCAHSQSLRHMATGARKMVDGATSSKKSWPIPGNDLLHSSTAAMVMMMTMIAAGALTVATRRPNQASSSRDPRIAPRAGDHIYPILGHLQPGPGGHRGIPPAAEGQVRDAARQSQAGDPAEDRRSRRASDGARRERRRREGPRSRPRRRTNTRFLATSTDLLPSPRTAPIVPRRDRPRPRYDAIDASTSYELQDPASRSLMSVVPDLYVHHRETRHRPPDAVLSAQTKDVDRLAAIDDEIWAAAERAFFHAQHAKLTSLIRSGNCSADEFGAKLRLYGAPVPQDGNVCTSAFHKNVVADRFAPSESVAPDRGASSTSSSSPRSSSARTT